MLEHGSVLRGEKEAAGRMIHMIDGLLAATEGLRSQVHLFASAVRDSRSRYQ
jgi:hypothetical protein